MKKRPGSIVEVQKERGYNRDDHLKCKFDLCLTAHHRCR